MKQFVFWTGIYNVVGGAGFILGIWSLVGVEFPESTFWAWGLGSAVTYTGVVLVLCSRALLARAPVVCWEGLLRTGAFFLFAGFGFLGGFGVVTGVLGIVDLIIGLVYLIGLPRSLDTTAMDLLFDRAA